MDNFQNNVILNFTTSSIWPLYITSNKINHELYTDTNLSKNNLNNAKLWNLSLKFKNENDHLCGEYEQYTLLRFILVSISSLIAFFGTIANMFLLVVFTIKKNPITPPTLYPRVLAILDAIICLAYIMLFGADAAIVYLHIKNLFILYYIYIVPAFVISRIAQIAIPYMLIFATLERFVWIAGNMQNWILKQMYSVRGRYITVAVTLLISILLRLPTAWATVIYDYPECNDFFRSKAAGVAEWVYSSTIYYVYDFHLLSIAQTVIPFFVLLALNFVIVKRLLNKNFPSQFFIEKFDANCCSPIVSQSNICFLPSKTLKNNLKTDSYAFLQKVSATAEKDGYLKSALYTMVCIVASYLICNSLHLFLTVLERSDSDLLKHPTDKNLASTFHTIFSDVVSFVYMFTSAIRIAIYYVCNFKIRDDINYYICKTLTLLTK